MNANKTNTFKQVLVIKIIVYHVIKHVKAALLIKLALTAIYHFNQVQISVYALTVSFIILIMNVKYALLNVEHVN